MASENTAIHDLLAGLQRKPLDQDPDDDVLFAGSRRDDGGLRRVPRGTQPPPNLFEMPAPVAGPLPPPQLAVALPYPQVAHGQYQATSRVSRTAVTRTNKKLYLIPAGLAIVAAVLVAILMGSKGEKPTQIAASGAPTGSAESNDEQPAVDVQAAKPVALPSVTPITPPAAAPPAGTSVAPIEPAAAPAVAAAPGEPSKDAVSPPEVVPASAFVAAQGTTVETVPTVPASSEPAAAPETDAAEAAPAPAKAKKSRRELAREKRGAKRASKRTTKRETKQVARAEPAEKTEGKLNGNGALAVSSSKPREVWVDGRNSKRMTPLRVLLKPGKHKVTLFDKENGTAKTFEVEIKADTTTKVSK